MLGGSRNIGPAGVTVVIIQEACGSRPVPVLHRIQTDNDSLYNTPAAAIYGQTGLASGGQRGWVAPEMEKSAIVKNLMAFVRH